MAVADASHGVTIEETVEYHHRPTEELDTDGQGNCHTAFAFVATVRSSTSIPISAW